MRVSRLLSSPGVCHSLCLWVTLCTRHYRNLNLHDDQFIFTTLQQNSTLLVNRVWFQISCYFWNRFFFPVTPWLCWRGATWPRPFPCSKTRLFPTSHWKGRCHKIDQWSSQSDHSGGKRRGEEADPPRLLQTFYASLQNVYTWPGTHGGCSSLVIKID